MCSETGHTRMVDLDVSPFVKTTLWWLILGTGLNGLGAYSTDQVLVQRYLATKSRRDMVRAIALNGVLAVPQIVCLFCVGLGLVAYYMLAPSLGATLHNKDQVLPHFIVNVLPVGAAGLVIAGMLAATMSSVSAGINSLSTATTIDFIQRFRRRFHFCQVRRPAGQVRRPHLGRVDHAAGSLRRANGPRGRDMYHSNWVLYRPIGSHVPFRRAHHAGQSAGGAPGCNHWNPGRMVCLKTGSLLSPLGTHRMRRELGSRLFLELPFCPAG